MKTISLFILLIFSSFLGIEESNNYSYFKEYTPNYAGTWDTDFGRMKIYQNGTKVYGSYSWYNGSFEGYITSNGIMVVTWEQDGGFTCSKGQAQFELNSAGDRFYGTWGCGSRSSGGGNWKGQKY